MNAALLDEIWNTQTPPKEEKTTVLKINALWLSLLLELNLLLKLHLLLKFKSNCLPEQLRYAKSTTTITTMTKTNSQQSKKKKDCGQIAAVQHFVSMGLSLQLLWYLASKSTMTSLGTLTMLLFSANCICNRCFASRSSLLNWCESSPSVRGVFPVLSTTTSNANQQTF